MGSFGTRVQSAGATFRPARTSHIMQYIEGSPLYERHREERKGGEEEEGRGIRPNAQKIDFGQK